MTPHKITKPQAAVLERLVKRAELQPDRPLPLWALAMQTETTYNDVHEALGVGHVEISGDKNGSLSRVVITPAGRDALAQWRQRHEPS